MKRKEIEKFFNGFLGTAEKKSKTKTLRIGLSLPSQTKPPVLEYQHNEWHLWTAYNKNFTAGTFLILYNDGTVTRKTINPDGTFEISPFS
jgi:hypothetical protein